jgi:hypothetical protein
MQRYFGIASFMAIACFVAQIILLGFVFKNIRILSLSSRKPYILAFVIMIVSMIICNNWILPENTSSERTAEVMLLLFNGLSFITLVVFHFAVAFVATSKDTKDPEAKK